MGRISVRGERILLDGIDVGLLELMEPERASENSKGIEINRLYLDEAHQRKGLGGAIVDFLFEFNPGISFIDVFPGGKSPAFWLRQGVSEVDLSGTMRITRASRAARACPTRSISADFFDADNQDAGAAPRNSNRLRPM